MTRIHHIDPPSFESFENCSFANRGGLIVLSLSDAEESDWLRRATSSANAYSRHHSVGAALNWPWKIPGSREVSSR